MAAYATVDQLKLWGAYALNELSGCPADDDDLLAVLERSSLDIDGFLRWPLPTDDDDIEPPLRIPVARFSAWEQSVIARACVYQCLYRLELGEDLDASQITTAPNVTFTTAAPQLIGQMALVALAGCETLHRFRSGLGSVCDHPGAWGDHPGAWGVYEHRIA
jgi:hypothetical protein